jgi:hypothetical protein
MKPSQRRLFQPSAFSFQLLLRAPLNQERRIMPSLQPSAFILQPFPLVGLERSTVGTGNLPFRDPANAGRRFIPLLMADAHHRKEPVAICDLESA